LAQGWDQKPGRNPLCDGHVSFLPALAADTVRLRVVGMATRSDAVLELKRVA
jgi:hypothetical protein